MVRTLADGTRVVTVERLDGHEEAYAVPLRTGDGAEGIEAILGQWIERGLDDGAEVGALETHIDAFGERLRLVVTYTTV